MPGSDTLVMIALGLAAIGAVLFVLRWAWNSRAQEGRSDERADTLEDMARDHAARDEKAREERSLSHAKWKKQGRPGPRRKPRA